MVIMYENHLSAVSAYAACMLHHNPPKKPLSRYGVKEAGVASHF